MARKKLYYKIGEACKILDIQPYVLRYWETEFPALSPDKSQSGQRVYTEEDFQVIRRIKELLYDEGYTIAGAKKKLDGELGQRGSSADPATTPADEERGKKAAAQPSRGAKSKKAAPRKSKRATASTAAGVGKGGGKEELDTLGRATVEKYRKALEGALQEVRGILADLDS